MIKPPPKTDKPSDTAKSDESTDPGRAFDSPGNTTATESLVDRLSRGGVNNTVAKALDAMSKATGYDPRIVELTKRAPTAQPMIERAALILRDPAHERFLAEQRAADARHKAELKAADRRAGLADIMCDALLARIREFEDALDIDEEILVALANFGQSMTIHIETLTYQDPHLLVFDGAGPDGEPVRLLQHTSQANVLLAKAKVAPGRPARRVGFRVAGSEPFTDDANPAPDSEE